MTIDPQTEADVDTVADRAGLRERIAAAIWERQNPGRRWADCEYRWRADAEEDADAVLSVLPGCFDPIECSHEAALGEARQEVRRLGLMVDEYGQGASSLTDKLHRARDMHRETCPLARGGVSSPAFRCGMCEVLDAPAVLPPAADRAAVERVRAVLETEAVVGRSALEYRGLIASALMADEAQQQPGTAAFSPGEGVHGRDPYYAGEAQPRFVRVCIACPECDHTLDENGACANGCHAKGRPS